jgi:leader peptidase (prepilin peptidase)/N-methyltransferase
MTDTIELLATTPWLFAAAVFLLGLTVGSFLNVVIHRLPIMLDREWKAQAREMLAEAGIGSPATSTPSSPPSTKTRSMRCSPAPGRCEP